MKKTITILLLVWCSALLKAQDVGMNCQYFPGLQTGFVSVKFKNLPGLDKYRFGAGAPLLMIDRITSHWYVNLDMSALYYAATQTNKANDDRIKISKAEGGYLAGRLGYLFGKGDNMRLGFSGNLGMQTSNLDSLKKPFKQKGYYNYGLGFVGYKKFGKLRVAGKAGFELYKAKNYILKGHGLYFEGTIGYSLYQKYGLSVMPCLYTKRLLFVPSGMTPSNAVDIVAKVKSFVLKFGITRFF